MEMSIGQSVVMLCGWGVKDMGDSKELQTVTRMWANAQRDGHPAEYRWRPLFNAAKFG